MPGEWTRERVLASFRDYGFKYGEGPYRKNANGAAREYYGLPSTATVAKYFGSWNDALEAAGFERRSRGAPGHENPIDRRSNGRFVPSA